MSDRRSELIKELVARRRKFHEQDFPTISFFAGTNVEKEVVALRRELNKCSLEELKARVGETKVKDAVLNCFPP